VPTFAAKSCSHLAVHNSLDAHSPLVSYLISLSSAMHPMTATPPAGVGGQHESKSKSGGHSSASNPSARLLSHSRRLSRQRTSSSTLIVVVFFDLLRGFDALCMAAGGLLQCALLHFLLQYIGSRRQLARTMYSHPRSLARSLEHSPFPEMKTIELIAARALENKDVRADAQGLSRPALACH